MMPKRESQMVSFCEVCGTGVLQFGAYTSCSSVFIALFTMQLGENENALLVPSIRSLRVPQGPLREPLWNPSGSTSEHILVVIAFCSVFLAECQMRLGENSKMLLIPSIWPKSSKNGPPEHRCFEMHRVSISWDVFLVHS